MGRAVRGPRARCAAWMGVVLWGVAGASSCSGAGRASDLEAQGGGAAPVEPTEVQFELNRMAVEAVGEGKPEKAHELLRAALSLGELNVTWLNLGRLHAGQGRCREAAQAYDAALGAPPVTNPAPAEVAQTVASYRRELLDEQCTGVLVLRCEPAGLEIVLDGRALACPGQPVALSWGQHRVSWRVAGQEATREFEIGPGEAVELELGVGP